MRSVIYDNYGIYPSEIDLLKFDYNGNTYHIFFTDKSEQEIQGLVALNAKLEQAFAGRVAKIISNRHNKYLTKYADTNIVIILIQAGAVRLKDVIEFHQLFQQSFQQQQFDVTALIKVWEERFTYIESEAVAAIRSDIAEYNTILETVFFGYGLAENALSYLADTNLDLGSSKIYPTLAHVRLPYLDCLTFFNPLNFYLDHSCRDIAELYKNGQLDITSMTKMLEQYHYSSYDACLLMARVLFPSNLFDLLEDFHQQKVDIRRQLLIYHQKSKDLLVRIRNLHLLLIRDYKIRPIPWLIDESIQL